MSSGGGGIGSTLTSGIQDIAAILPLFGTEQCSIHVSSALPRGYLYAASAFMSIFGSLWVVSAELRTLVTYFSFGHFEGADLLENMGLEPQGENPVGNRNVEADAGVEKKYQMDARRDMEEAE